MNVMTAEPAAPKKPAAPKAPAPPTAATTTDATEKRHRVDFRMAPETLSALDKLAAEANINRTAMLEKLIGEASQHLMNQGIAREAAQIVSGFRKSSKSQAVTRALPPGKNAL